MRILAGATTALRRIVDLGLVILILVVLLGVVLGKGAPLVGRQSIVIGGGSMEPTIGLGSAIIVRPVDPAGLAVGDVVSLRVGPEQTTYTHRIIALVEHADGRWIRTQGDANAAPDPTLVPASAVIGRVELVIPLAGYLLALLSLPMGVMFVLGLAATLLAIAWLLESLELEPRPARRMATVPAQSPSIPASEPAPVPAAAAVASGPDIAHGEPIAARPAVDAESGTGRGRRRRARPSRAEAALSIAGLPAVSASTADLMTVAAPTARPIRPAASYARPTVREQLARSREIRDRRARWLLGRGRTPLTD